MSSISNRDYSARTILSDETFIYVVTDGPRITRFNRTTFASDTVDVQAAGISAAAGGFGIAEQDSNYIYVVADGAGGFTSQPMRVVRLLKSDFSPSGLSYVNITAAGSFGAFGMARVGTKLIISSCTKFTVTNPKVYSLDLTDFSTVSSAALSHFLGRGVSDGSNAYFCPMQVGFDAFTPDVHPPRAYFGAKISPSLTVTYFDIRDDANVVSIGTFGTNVPWVDSTYLYFLTNVDTYIYNGPVNLPRVSRRRLSDLSVGSGFDLTSLFDPSAFGVFQGAFANGKHVISGFRCIVELAQDLSSGTFHS